MVGQALVKVVYGEQEAKVPVLVVPGDGPSLLGRNWLKLIRLNWPEIKKVSLELDTLLSTVSIRIFLRRNWGLFKTTK